MGAPVEFRDRSTLVEAWKLHNSPYFGIFQGKELKFTNEDDDVIEAEDMLDKNLQYLEKAGTSAIYTLRVYPKPPVTAKADYKGSMTFRFSDFDIMPMRGRQGDENIYVINQGGRAPAVAGAPAPTTTDAKLDRLIELMTLQMQAQQADEEEDEDEEEQEPEQSEEERTAALVERWTMIGERLSGVLLPVLQAVFPRQSNYQDQNISGMETPVTDEQLQQAISQVMQALGDEEFRRVMVGLAKMATQNPAQLQMLAKMVN